jgi:hypothetical protein
MTGNVALREELARLSGLRLDAARFRDYCPNGLQVEGREQVRRIVCGVTASQALIEAAIERGRMRCWCITAGSGKRRTAASPDFASSAWRACWRTTSACSPTTCRWMRIRSGQQRPAAATPGWTVDGRFGEQDIGFFGVPPAPTSAVELARQVANTPWAASRCWSAIRNAQVAHRLVQRRRAGLLRGCAGDRRRPVSFRARFQSRPCIWRAKPAWPSSPPATMPPSALASWRWAAICPEQLGIECEFVDIDNPA